ncbi:putative bifunctional diguanylate cyclase/phosphodiesterase [Ralstonia pseudosolanacearum]|uniref:putative bifunctional diguanylate cyclase/phosphodiesterase n=1 Tax=Ralstonia pseudosolanacearum TaxID=1310165 RepID=UPI001FF7C554|nr:bifunctional diguanylate cyclase/phosphodiesterase [Ralstonia pseudosolanacearum]MDO3523059.1 bifunctional diguanylate cyclase/phosphodiesterase [Ralstonia pseudosolanacearum]MDO3546633.1 bifunctional diguanylate cyclase/phosphodiesterase [Ralstonia pseudosolanacearum]MDO3552097.1 bifunctional diguanylate cyclase/phosphodiesterase [Ralstonia pseudosolanacearum]MDO3565937.1 bifunctional diguanylate cyclase/phosphodiesterase [Ralstonia pseudosolanacearum]MDO3581784.1 bifunctional diguanylate 
MHNNFHIALLLFAWTSVGLTTFAALDAATRLPGGASIAKRRVWRLACGVILGAGLWSGLWLAEAGLHRLPAASATGPLTASLAVMLAASLIVFVAVLPRASFAAAARPLGRRRIALAAAALGMGLVAVELMLTRPWLYAPRSLLQTVTSCGGGTLILLAGASLAICMAFWPPASQRRAAVGVRARAAGVLATSAALSLIVWPCAGAQGADDTLLHAIPIIVLSAGGILLALGLHAALMMFEARIDSAQAHLAASLERVTRQSATPEPHDTLTGLPTRLQLQQALDSAILSSSRRGRPFALFYLDLDGLGRINEQHGRATGDRVLEIIAERLRQTMRDEDTVARLGSDEFGLLVEGLPLPEAAAPIGDKLLFRLREAVEVDGRRLRVAASIGVAIHPYNGATADALLAHADAAMFECKQAGGNAYRFYEPRLNTTAHRVLQIQRALSHAALNGQLFLYYQPKFDAHTQSMTGAEALLRWNHPELGPVSPAEFLPLAERTGTIVELGDWVIEEVCRQIMHWDAAGMVPLKIAINLSPRQFLQSDLVQRLSQILYRYQVAPDRLMFEITETAAMRDAGQSIAAIRQIQSLGFEVAIDDFGTGYSSLSYLQRFRAQQIKIDRAFIGALDDSPSDAYAIIRAICAMAHSLDMTVVAEGVETGTQMQALVNLRCDQVQGYLLGRPLPARDFQTLIDHRQVA